MIGPIDINLPFFAYGLFKRGELGFLSIADLVDRVDEPVKVNGGLLLRDGLPILKIGRDSYVLGSLIYFKQGCSSKAYQRINKLEPERQYRWEETTIQGLRCNYLIGKSPSSGSIPADEGWNGRKDPLFTAAIEVVKEALGTNEGFDSDLRPMFRLQMAYLLLWSSIERYASLRYTLSKDVHSKVMRKRSGPY